MAKINENLEQTKARNRAWFDFQKPPGEHKPVNKPVSPHIPRPGMTLEQLLLTGGKQDG